MFLAGVVTIVAGSGTASWADGVGTAASFNQPVVVADNAETLYVSDYGGHRVRKIATSTVVTTFAGSGESTFANGVGTAAILRNPEGVGVDSNGDLYVGDGTSRIRKIFTSGAFLLSLNVYRNFHLRRSCDYLCRLWRGTFCRRHWHCSSFL